MQINMSSYGIYFSISMQYLYILLWLTEGFKK